jgi:hypothetical protein
MPTINFPELEPNSRDFSGERWPTTSTRSRAGTTSTLGWGDSPSDPTLTLGYRNRPDEEIALLCQCHRSARGGLFNLYLPEHVFRGAKPELRAFLSAAGLGLTWRFPLDFVIRIPNSELPGTSSTTIELVANLIWRP